MSGVKWRRDQRIAKSKILRREYSWGCILILSSASFYLQSKKLWAMFDGRHRPFRVCACAVR